MLHLSNLNKIGHLLVSALLLFVSCADLSNDGFDPRLFTNHIEMQSRSYENCDLQSDSCTFILISNLVFDHLSENKNLQNISRQVDNIILGKDAKDVETECKNFIEDYDRIINDSLMKVEEYSLAWYDIRKAEVISIKKRVVSIKCSIKSFYGGAHPNEYIYLRNFMPETGDSLGIAMIFNPKSLKELRSLAEFIFRKKYDLSEEVSYDDAGYWFENNTFELSANFAFTDHGLWFYYNKYEIAPYSMGSSEIVIPYSIIMHLFE